MAVKPWWAKGSVVAAGVLLAAALGIWQAARVADALGFGPGTKPGPKPGSAQAGGERRPGGGTASAGARLDDPLHSLWVAPGAATAPGLAGAPAEGEASAPVDPADPEGGEHRTDAAREAAERFGAQMGRFISDLEFSPGTREPRQQTVLPAPTPWRPPPDDGARPPPVIEAVAPRAAKLAGGTRVVIRGRNLRVAQVMFGAAAARIIGATAEAVTVEAPPGKAGQVVIAVTNDDGTWALASEPFTYVR
jgi:hypothetical protein